MPFEFCDCDVVQFARGNARMYSRTHCSQYCSQQGCLHLVDILVTIYFSKFVLVTIVIEQANSLVEEYIQPSLYRFYGIVGALVEFTAIDVTDTRHLWRPRMYVVDVLVRPADVPSREPLKQFLARDVQVDDEIYLPPNVLQSFIQRLRLCDCAREAVEQDTTATIRLRDATEYQWYSDVIGNQLTSIEVYLGFYAQFSLLIECIT